jgi:hypothetical protein
MSLTGVLPLVVTATIAVTTVIGVAWLGARALRNLRKGAAVGGWVLLFLGFGIPPPPTPQQQVEDMNRERGSKQRTGTDTLDDDPIPPPRSDE